MEKISPYTEQIEIYQSLQSRWDKAFGGGSIIQAYLLERDKLLSEKGEIIPGLPSGLDSSAKERYSQEIREKLDQVMPQLLKNLEAILEKRLNKTG